MKIALGSDHAGFRAKEQLAEHLRRLGHEVNDLGTHSEESTDYPDYARLVGEAVRNHQSDMGVLVCGTGIGVAMAANKIRGIRAAVCHNLFTAEVTRSHNDANVLCLGARILDVEEMKRIAEKFLSTPHEGGRHARRVRKIADIENYECGRGDLTSDS